MIPEALKGEVNLNRSAIDDLRLIRRLLGKRVVFVLVPFILMFVIDAVMSVDRDWVGFNLPFTGIYFALVTAVYLAVSGMLRMETKPIFGLGLMLSALFLTFEVSYVLLEVVFPGFVFIYFGLPPG